MRKLLRGLAITFCVGFAHAQVSERVSVALNGAQSGLGGDLNGPGNAVISGDGRFVLFISPDPNLVPGDTNAAWDVFLRDRLTPTTERISVDSSGNEANGTSGLYGISITPDGRYVVFDSAASNLVSGDTNGVRDIFVRDRSNGTTERVSLDSSGLQGNGDSLHASISPDGRFLVFYSDATNLVPGDTNGQPDIFLRDRVNGTTEIVSIATNGGLGNSVSDYPVVSADGRFVAFSSDSTNLSPADTNQMRDVFLRDRQLGLTTRVSRSSSGAQGNGHSNFPRISSDGRHVAFMSLATNLVVGDTNGKKDIFINDRLSAVTERVSVGPGGIESDGDSDEASFSQDGRFLAFQSAATNLVVNCPTAIRTRIYVRDLLAGTNEIVSVATNGTDPNNGGCGDPWISADGRYVASRSPSSDLVPGDTNGAWDVFIHDRLPAGFTSFCDPGQNGVIDCPCANAPIAAGRGCDNSSSTGGAALGASGHAYLAIDSLAFTTQFERPNATSILLQGDAQLANGIAFGQGVRCVGGTLKRLFVKVAVNGSISAPDFGAGDATISTRSAQLGLVLQPGVPSFYAVYYRDPVVLGGCSSSFTYNCTQAGSVSYWP